MNRPARLDLRLDIEHWPLRAPFRITGYTFTVLEVLVARLGDGEHQGQGEAAGVYYLGDRPQGMKAQVEAVRGAIEAGISREELQRLLPAGGARNAVDCALWDLEARQRRTPAWRLAGLSEPRPLVTTYTLGADAPQVMADAARAFPAARALKLKLTGEPVDLDRVLAVRAARPDVWMGVDANQGLDRDSYAALAPVLAQADVRLLEQPFPRGAEALMDGLASAVPIAADESVQIFEDIAPLAGRVQAINIKLDKCGGLTEGLRMAREAHRLGLQVMVGNMMGTALAMAPAHLLAQLCEVVDLDGPIVLAADREPGIVHEHGLVSCPPAIWGGGA